MATTTTPIPGRSSASPTSEAPARAPESEERRLSAALAVSEPGPAQWLQPPGLPADSAVLILPVQAVGASDEHRAYPGTLTLSPETALRAFIEIGESVHRAGIRKLVIINSHGGNIALIDLAARQLRVRHAMLAVHASWGRFGYPDGLFSADERTHGIHGGDIETSIMLAAFPDLVRREKIADFRPATYAMERDHAFLRADYPAGFGWMTQDLNASGAVGDASLATAEKGEAALDHGARAFVALLHDVEKFDLARLAAGPLGQPVLE